MSRSALADTPAAKLLEKEAVDLLLDGASDELVALASIAMSMKQIAEILGAITGDGEPSGPYLRTHSTD